MRKKLADILKKTSLLTVMLVTAVVLGATANAAVVSPDTPHALVGMNYKLITDVMATGQKVTAVVVEYESDVLASENLKKTYGVTVN